MSKYKSQTSSSKPYRFLAKKFGMSRDTLRRLRLEYPDVWNKSVDLALKLKKEAKPFYSVKDLALLFHNSKPTALLWVRKNNFMEYKRGKKIYIALIDLSTSLYNK